MTISVNSSQNAATPLAAPPLSAIEICERALRKIQAYAINDEAADPDEVDESLQWLSLIIKEITGTRRCYWLTPETVTFDWPINEPSVVLADAMGKAYPPTGIQFPIRAWMVNNTTGLREREIPLVRRKEYERRIRHSTNGPPSMLFIDRLVERQTAYAWPVPNTPDPSDPGAPEWQIALEFQVYSRSVFGEQGGEQSGDVPHGFSTEWELFIVTRLAAEIGDGPVKSVDINRVKEWRALAAASLSELLYANREKNNRPFQTRRYGG